MHLLCLQHHSEIPGELLVQIVGVVECSEVVMILCAESVFTFLMALMSFVILVLEQIVFISFTTLVR
jgi:hypothetical protein